jgi:predicted O-linked N-acetylglucosamine transferase (SPINDLY family)
MQDRFDLIDVHRAWGEKEEEIAAREPIVHKVRQRLDNKIRIGIMSSDLRNHPVGYFAWPIIEHINRNEFELYTYSYYPHEAGALQKAFMHSVNSHKNYIIESNNEAAQSIADDQLDIMFELGGTTAYNRISVCAYKPAPVQVSWLGYPHSIGLPTTIDYIMVDPYINPQIKGLLIEKPFIMPKTWVVIEDKIGFKQVPILEQIPEDRNGYITLGTLNIPHKLTLESFKIWAELMHQIPNSRLDEYRQRLNNKKKRSAVAPKQTTTKKKKKN